MKTPSPFLHPHPLAPPATSLVSYIFKLHPDSERPQPLIPRSAGPRPGRKPERTHFRVSAPPSAGPAHWELPPHKPTNFRSRAPVVPDLMHRKAPGWPGTPTSGPPLPDPSAGCPPPTWSQGPSVTSRQAIPEHTHPKSSLGGELTGAYYPKQQRSAQVFLLRPVYLLLPVAAVCTRPKRK